MPGLKDGAAIWSLVRNCGTLEANSAYAYLVLGAHFAETSVIAERGGRLAGFVWGFLSPSDPDALFVWQIGVAAEARGEGVGRELLKRLLSRPACDDVRYLEATVTPSNDASAALFRAVARDLEAPCVVTQGFPREVFPEGAHEPEKLFRIGPIA